MSIENPITNSLFINATEFSFNNEELFKELESTEDEDEKCLVEERILQNNVRLVFHIVRQRFGTSVNVCERLRMTTEDLYSIGTFALLKAIQSFSLDKNIKFVTYSSMVINNEISMFLRRDGKRFGDVSGDEQVGSGNDADNKATKFDLTPSEEDVFEDFIEDSNNNDFLREIGNQLGERELKILVMHFYEDKTQREISVELDISQSYVSRLLQSTLLKARKIYEQMEES